jgi:hypothetical protein
MCTSTAGAARSLCSGVLGLALIVVESSIFVDVSYNRLVKSAARLRAAYMIATRSPRGCGSHQGGPRTPARKRRQVLAGRRSHLRYRRGEEPDDHPERCRSQYRRLRAIPGLRKVLSRTKPARAGPRNRHGPGHLQSHRRSPRRPHRRHQPTRARVGFLLQAASSLKQR